MDETNPLLAPTKKTYFLSYLGSVLINRHYVKYLQNWVAADLKYQRKTTYCSLLINENNFCVSKEERVLINLTDTTANGNLNSDNDNHMFKGNGLDPLSGFSHPLSPLGISEEKTKYFSILSEESTANFALDEVIEIISPTNLNATCVGFIVDKLTGCDSSLSCHVFEDSDIKMVKEAAETLSKFLSYNEKVSLTTCSSMISKNVKREDLDSVRFEVMMLGKIQVKQEYPHNNFIDEAVEKYHSLEKEHKILEAQSSQKQVFAVNELTQINTNGIEKLPSSLLDGSREGSVDILKRKTSMVTDWSGRRGSVDEERQRCNSVDADSMASLRKQRTRTRHRSEPGTAATLGFDKNKTKLMQVGKQSITLISPDHSTKSIEIPFTAIIRCAKGIRNKEYFGVFTKDNLPHNSQFNKDEFRFRCYLFLCSEECVCEEILQAMKQACNMCSHGPDPLKTYQTLCKQLALGSGKENAAWMERGMKLAAKCIAESFNDSEQKRIKLKIEESYKFNSSQSKYEKLVFVMTTLRIMFEEKQTEHDLKVKQLRDPNSSNMSKKFNFIKSRAKKSLTNIENLFGKGMQKMHELQHEAEHHISSPVEKLKFFGDSTRSAPSTPIQSSGRSRNRSGSPSSFTDISPLAGSTKSKHIALPEPIRPRSNTIGSTEQGSINVRRKLNLAQNQQENNLNKPASSISGSQSSLRSLSSESTPIQSRSHSPSLKDHLTPDHGKKQLSFHQEIFFKVTTPDNRKKKYETILESPSIEEYMRPPPPSYDTPNEVRFAWRRAIKDQILLNKINKIKDDSSIATQENGDVVEKTILDYPEPSSCHPEMSSVWEELIETDERELYKIDPTPLHNAVKKGVPCKMRGQVWTFLFEQWKLQQHAPRKAVSPVDKTPYRELLKRLTPHQHAILIDLGRTFPSHPYFSQQLGKGQLALYNLLKAYSLVDDDVGYCQGLSFVAGIILIHMSSADRSYKMLCHLMIGMETRKLYLPDLIALQIAVYQLSRLLHDFHKDLYDHFQEHDVTLMLFVAPWFLTMFASILPFGFTARIFDLLFLEGTSALFKAAFCLLQYHKENILLKDSFEGTVNYLKSDLPKMKDEEINIVINEIFELNISEKLRVYEVEYNVLEEGVLSEQPSPGGSEELELNRLERVNETVSKYNVELLEQLEAARMQISSLQQGLNDMVNMEEKRCIEMEELKRENEALKQKVM